MAGQSTLDQVDLPWSIPPLCGPENAGFEVPIGTIQRGSQERRCHVGEVARLLEQLCAAAGDFFRRRRRDL